MLRPLSPSEGLLSVENSLCLVNLNSPNLNFDESLCATPHKLYASFMNISGAIDLLHAADIHVRSMYKARDENNLDAAESERKAALAACIPLRKIASSIDSDWEPSNAS